MAREPCCAIYTRTWKMERMIQLRRLPTPTLFIPRSSARRSGSPFLSPEVTSAILEGRQPKGLSLAQIPKLLPLSWTKHRPLLG
jgi:hypothetical protein